MIAISSGVMPFGSAVFTPAPASTRTFAASSRPSRAANSSGVRPPGAGACSPCGGTPLRTIPTPCDPPPAPGGRAAGFGPARVAASAEAPEASSSRMIAVWFRRAAHMSGVCARSGSAAFARAPRSSNSRTASTLSARTAAINSVSPAASAVFTSARASSRRARIAALPFCAAT